MVDDVQLSLSEQSKRTLAKLVTAEATKDLRKELTGATAGIVPAVRQAARDLPSSRKRASRKNGSLRSAIAYAITRKIKVSTRKIMVVITSVPRGGKSNLARAVEGDIPWKHPVYGRQPDVTQEPHPFFYRTVQKFGPEVESRVRSVLVEFERKL